MLNYIWLGLILIGVLVGGFSGRMKEMVEGTLQSAQTAVTLSLGLIGIMALWLGVMRLAERAGLIQTLAAALRPVLKLLFPSVPAEHPAMGSMLMNIAANMLGLNNAATPLGIRAMRDLESINPHPGVATNAMCTFLAINTSSVQLIPVTAVGILAAAGSKAPAVIIGTAILATTCAAVAAVTAVKSLEKLPVFRVPFKTGSPLAAGQGAPSSAPDPTGNSTAPVPSGTAAMAPWGWALLLAFVGCFGWFFAKMAFPGVIGEAGSVAQPSAAEPEAVRIVNALSLLAIPFLLGFFPLYAALRRVPVYEEFVEGAKEGFNVAVRIIPFLVAMLVAIGLFRSAGAFEFLTRLLKPALDVVRFPSELVPISLMRPLSGSASLGLLTDLVRQHGPDSLLARTAATLYGSTETTFYVVAVYFGAVSVKRTRHAVPAGLIADAVGAIASVAICRLVFGP
jgi:spore maturation protein SpmA